MICIGALGGEVVLEQFSIGAIKEDVGSCFKIK